jgi:phosphotransferase system  glucose/maltose/N-acetylglucosamine-specific IIC component
MMHQLSDIALAFPVNQDDNVWLPLIYSAIAICFPFLFTWYLKKTESRKDLQD